MNKTIGSILPLVGRVFTPAAMVVFLTYEITRSQPIGGWWQTAVIIGAAATAVGVEVVGILSGHALEVSWRINDKARAAVAFILLLIYTGAGVWILRHNATLMPIPIIAAVVYLVAALVDGLEVVRAKQASDEAQRQAFELEQQAAAQTQAQELALLAQAAAERQAEEDARQLAFEREQAARDRELERELKRQAQADKTALSLAQIEAKKAATFRQDARQDTSKMPPENGALPGDWRQVTRQQRRDLAHMTREERAQIMPELSERAQRDWHNRLDEIAKQNGEYKS